jgi:hypothetical protein
LGLRLNASGPFGNWLDRPGTLIDSREYLPTMAEWNADVLQILIGQMGDYRNVNLILGKTRGVLTEVELLKPVRNLLHLGTCTVEGVAGF